MSAEAARSRGLKPLARVLAYASHAQEPEWFTTAPVGAIKKVLQQLSWSAHDADLYEINEAFAAVTMAAMHDLDIDHARVNVNGGACALGHPIGATGARILTTLLYALRQRGGRRGIASLCIGGGRGGRRGGRTPLAPHRTRGTAMKIQDARAVITGGASGLGHAVARHLSAHGGKVVILDVQEGPGQAAADRARRRRALPALRRHLRGRGERGHGGGAPAHGRPQPAGQLRRRGRRRARARQERADGRRVLHQGHPHQPDRHVPVRQGRGEPDAEQRAGRATASAACSSTPPRSPPSRARSGRRPTRRPRRRWPA